MQLMEWVQNAISSAHGHETVLLSMAIVDFQLELRNGNVGFDVPVCRGRYVTSSPYKPLLVNCGSEER